MSSITHVRLVEGEDLELLVRPQTPAGVTLTRAEISAATLTIYERGSDTGTSKTLALTADPPGASYDECMFAALQQDESWTQAGGYTFWQVVRYVTDYTFEGGKSYRVEVRLSAGHTSPTWPNRDDYGDIVLVWLVACESTAGA